MKSTDILIHEHGLIKRMLNVLSNYSIKMELNKKVPPEKLKMCVNFVMEFVDACHYHKEEGILYAEMEAQGMPRSGVPVDVILTEHYMGRNYVKGMAKAIDDYEKGVAGSDKEFVKNAQGYIGLLNQHIHKEDSILFPMAEDMFSDMDAELVERFEEVDKKLGEGLHEKYENIVSQLENDSSS